MEWKLAYVDFNSLKICSEKNPSDTASAIKYWISTSKDRAYGIRSSTMPRPYLHEWHRPPPTLANVWAENKFCSLLWFMASPARCIKNGCFRRPTWITVSTGWKSTPESNSGKATHHALQFASLPIGLPPNAACSCWDWAVMHGDESYSSSRCSRQFRCKSPRRSAC